MKYDDYCDSSNFKFSMSGLLISLIFIISFLVNGYLIGVVASRMTFIGFCILLNVTSIDAKGKAQFDQMKELIDKIEK